MDIEKRMARLTDRLVADVLELYARELARRLASGEVSRARSRATDRARGPLPPRGPARRDFLAARLEEHRGDVSAIARGLGHSRGTVHRWIHESGLVPDDFRKFDRSVLITQLKLHDGHVSRAANAMQCSRGALHRWIKEAGLSARDFRPARGFGR